MLDCAAVSVRVLMQLASGARAKDMPNILQNVTQGPSASKESALPSDVFVDEHNKLVASLDTQ